MDLWVSKMPGTEGQSRASAQSSHTNLGKLLNLLSATGGDILWLAPGCSAPELLGGPRWLSLQTPAARVARPSGQGDAEPSSGVSRNGQAKDKAEKTVQAEGVTLGTPSRWRLIERKGEARDEAVVSRPRGLRRGHSGQGRDDGRMKGVEPGGRRVGGDESLSTGAPREGGGLWGPKGAVPGGCCHWRGRACERRCLGASSGPHTEAV